jgi:hypothetical protein
MTRLQDNCRIYGVVDGELSRTPRGIIFYRNPNEPQRYLPCADPLQDHFADVSFTPRALEKTRPPGVSTPMLILVRETSILKLVTGGRVWRARSNKPNWQDVFGEGIDAHIQVHEIN